MNTAESASLNALLEASHGEVFPYRQFFEGLSRAVPHAEGLLVSSVFRGGLQIAQPPKVTESFLKIYARERSADDQLTWQVILQNRPMRITEAFADGFNDSRYYRELMQVHGLEFAAAAPLREPLLTGYPGALHLYRAPEQGEFTDAELATLGEVAAALDKAIAKVRRARLPEACRSWVWSHAPQARQLVLDAQLNIVFPKAGVLGLDERLQEQIMQHARFRLEHLEETPAVADRLQLPDQRGDLWTFRVVTFQKYRALGSGPFIFFCVQPEACDWATVRPSDFAADAELSRLVPALRFMQQEFHRSPTLGEIARTVHLSPFHFHRRFTELLGLTPKHFLLECQITEAKRQLMARQKHLRAIATDCGFAHQSHFTSRFKQATGLTPTRWRRLATDLEKASTN